MGTVASKWVPAYFAVYFFDFVNNLVAVGLLSTALLQTKSKFVFMAEGVDSDV